MEAKPLPFINIAEDGTLKVCEEAIKVLKGIKEPLHVVAVAGLYRTGKSFLLNQLLGKNAGFKIGSTIEACTKGLWLWGQPIRVDGKLVLFIDTEGIASVDQHGTNDVKVFALAILLSSYFVYNSMGTIDESAIDRLSLVVELTKHIRARSEGDQSTSDLADFFPRFMWLVRDHMLSIEKDGVELSAPEYLEWALQPSKRSQTNKVRESIKALFRDRDCCTLVRPVNDEKQLRKVADLPESSLRPEFVAAMKDMKKGLFSKLKPKVMYGQPLTGASFVLMAEQYVEALNNGAVPTMSTAWENVTNSENSRAVKESVEAHKKFFVGASISANNPDGLMAEFQKVAEQAEKSARAVFKSIILGDPSTYTTHEEDLSRAIATEYQHRHNEVKANVDKLFQSSIDAIMAKVEKKTHRGEYPSLDALREDIEKALAEQRKTASIALTGELLIQAISGRIMPLMVRLSDAMLLSERKLREEEVRSATAKATQELGAKHSAEVGDLRLRERELQVRLQASEAEATKRIAELTDSNKQLRAENDRLSSESRVAHSSLSGTVAKLEAKLEHSEAERQRERRDLEARLKESEAVAKRSEAELKALEKNQTSASTQNTKRVAQLEAQIESLREDLEMANSEKSVGSKVTADYKAKLAAAEREAADLKASARSLEADKSKLRATISALESAAAEESEARRELAGAGLVAAKKDNVVLRGRIADLEAQLAAVQQSDRLSGSKRAREEPMEEDDEVQPMDDESPAKKPKRGAAVSKASTSRATRAEEDVEMSSEKENATKSKPAAKKTTTPAKKNEAAKLAIGNVKQMVKVMRGRGCDVGVKETEKKPGPWCKAYDTHVDCLEADNCLLAE